MDTWSDAQIVSLEGHAVKAFLQGYLTCNSDRIVKNSPTPMALCNLKGRVIANGWAQGDDAQVLLVVHNTVASELATFLRPYAMFSKCKVEALDHPVNVSAHSTAVSPFCGHWCFAENLLLCDAASDASARIAQDLVEDRFAWVSSNIAGKYLPQVLGLHEVGAVDFDKGCYLGQEIVARTQFRGAVKRGIDVFEWQGLRPAAGDDWSDAVKGKGTVVCAACWDDSDSGHGLWVRGLG